MNSKVIWGIIAILVIIGGIYWISANNTPNEDTNITIKGNEEAANNTGDKNEAEGRVVFSVTDAAANMSSFSEVNMVVNKVEVYSAARGWVSVSSTPHAYNLLDLDAKNQSKLLADVNTEAGEYSQVRLTIDSVAVKTKNGVSKVARLPAKQMAIATKLVVEEDSTSSVNFDVLADKSLHVTADGDYIFAPVVKTETRSDTEVKTDTASVVTITGGHVDSTSTVGMDIDGSVKINFELKTGAKLDIDASGVIKIQ